MTARLVHELFEATAAERPDQELLVMHDPGGGRVGYGAVDAARLLKAK